MNQIVALTVDSLNEKIRQLRDELEAAHENLKALRQENVELKAASEHWHTKYRDELKRGCPAIGDSLP